VLLVVLQKKLSITEKLAFRHGNNRFVYIACQTKSSVIEGFFAVLCTTLQISPKATFFERRGPVSFNSFYFPM
jgi:hypothetical protein